MSLRKNAGFKPLCRAAMVVAAASGLAACNIPGEGIGKQIVTGGGAGKSVADVSPDAFVAPPWCPPISVERNKFLVMNYERGKDGDASALIYQASIEKWAVGCKRVNGQTQVTVGVSGRITPGPVWKGGEVLLPVHVNLIESGEAEAEDKKTENVFTVPVTLGEGAPAELWNLVESSITIPPDARPKITIALDEAGKSARR
ncbi:hypothetical protein H2509_14825 [Stappia sp. F7233]|uniref:Lipoprotein n=1 Tax=Stappia albiluteola TaxID=2758565 RepID=A0A839AFI2_9HYPH|nr:hypothetical protein [Stappia albiluteola]MBA5778401.1 hypothetical protein [Stappia albiluteola]